MKIFGVSAVAFPLVGGISIDNGTPRHYDSIEFTTTKETSRLCLRDLVEFADGTMAYVTGLYPSLVEVMSLQSSGFTEEHLTMDFEVVCATFPKGAK